MYGHSYMGRPYMLVSLIDRPHTNNVFGPWSRYTKTEYTLVPMYEPYIIIPSSLEITLSSDIDSRTLNSFDLHVRAFVCLLAFVLIRLFLHSETKMDLAKIQLQPCDCQAGLSRQHNWKPVPAQGNAIYHPDPGYFACWNCEMSMSLWTSEDELLMKSQIAQRNLHEAREVRQRKELYDKEDSKPVYNVGHKCGAKTQWVPQKGGSGYSCLNCGLVSDDRSANLIDEGDWRKKDYNAAAADMNADTDECGLADTDIDSKTATPISKDWMKLISPSTAAHALQARKVEFLFVEVPIPSEQRTVKGDARKPSGTSIEPGTGTGRVGRRMRRIVNARTVAVIEGFRETRLKQLNLMAHHMIDACISQRQRECNKDILKPLTKSGDIPALDSLHLFPSVALANDIFYTAIITMAQWSEKNPVAMRSHARTMIACALAFIVLAARAHERFIEPSMIAEVWYNQLSLEERESQDEDEEEGETEPKSIKNDDEPQPMKIEEDDQENVKPTKAKKTRTSGGNQSLRCPVSAKHIKRKMDEILKVRGGHLGVGENCARAVASATTYEQGFKPPVVFGDWKASTKTFKQPVNPEQPRDDFDPESKVVKDTGSYFLSKAPQSNPVTWIKIVATYLQLQAPRFCNSQHVPNSPCLLDTIPGFELTHMSLLFVAMQRVLENLFITASEPLSDSSVSQLEQLDSASTSPARKKQGKKRKRASGSSHFKILSNGFMPALGVIVGKAYTTDSSNVKSDAALSAICDFIDRSMSIDSDLRKRAVREGVLDCASLPLVNPVPNSRGDLWSRIMARMPKTFAMTLIWLLLRKRIASSSARLLLDKGEEEDVEMETENDEPTGDGKSSSSDSTMDDFVKMVLEQVEEERPSKRPRQTIMLPIEQAMSAFPGVPVFRMPLTSEASSAVGKTDFTAFKERGLTPDDRQRHRLPVINQQDIMSISDITQQPLTEMRQLCTALFHECRLL